MTSQEYQRQYRRKNKEALSQKKKSYYQKNKGKIRDKQREYYQENKEKAYRRNAVLRARYKRDNPEFKIKENLRRRFLACLKGNRKEEHLFDLIGCSLKQFQEYIESQFLDGMDWDNYGLWHLDHIKPLKAFNLLYKEERKLAWHYTNFQPLWAVDNLKKGANYNG